MTSATDCVGRIRPDFGVPTDLRSYRLGRWLLPVQVPITLMLGAQERQLSKSVWWSKTSMDELYIRVIVKVMPKPEWTRALALGTYAGSPDDARDGFIHLSTPQQLSGTLEKYYKGQSDLVAIAYSPDELGDGLKWEISRGGERFPHLYGMLPANASLPVFDVFTGDDGIPLVPTELLQRTTTQQDAQA
ncbi:MAG: DUF952 domain-containing protein [Pseudomonadota bacterium]